MNDNCVKVLLLNSNREDYSRYKRLIEGFFSWFKQVVIVADWCNDLARKFAEENGYKMLIKKQNSYLSVPWEYYLVELICSSDVVMMFSVENTEFIRRVLELAEERNKPLVYVDKTDEAIPLMFSKKMVYRDDFGEARLVIKPDVNCGV